MSTSKRSQRALLYIFLSLFISMSLFTIFGERGVIHLLRLWEEKSALEDKNFVLKSENEALRERIHRIRHDDHYLEKLAREELGLVRPGEIVYRFASSEAKRKAFIEPQPPRSSGRKLRQ